MTPQMNTPVLARSDDSGWTRVSSFKPQLVTVLLAAIAMCASIILFELRNPPMIAAGTTVAMGLIALTSKVVHRRGNDYRISTLFYSEVATVDDVCMTVTKRGPLWTRFRIHLRRPVRFGWTVTFVPTNDALAAFRQNECLSNPQSRNQPGNENKHQPVEPNEKKYITNHENPKYRSA